MTSERESLQQRLAAWHGREYGQTFRQGATFRKLCEEVGELGQAVIGLESSRHAGEGGPFEDEWQNEVIEEAADVALVLSHIVREVGGDLFAAMEQKLARLEGRQHRKK